jgi:hypothetical protein
MIINIENLKQSLKGLGNEQLQRISWLEGNHGAPWDEAVPYIDELTCQIFDDTALVDYWDEPAGQDQLGQEGEDALRRLLLAIGKLPSDPTPKELMSHPVMTEVRRIAKEALVALENRS